MRRLESFIEEAKTAKENATDVMMYPAILLRLLSGIGALPSGMLLLDRQLSAWCKKNNSNSLASLYWIWLGFKTTTAGADF